MCEYKGRYCRWIWRLAQLLHESEEDDSGTCEIDVGEEESTAMFQAEYRPRLVLRRVWQLEHQGKSGIIKWTFFISD